MKKCLEAAARKVHAPPGHERKPRLRQGNLPGHAVLQGTYVYRLASARKISAVSMDGLPCWVVVLVHTYLSVRIFPRHLRGNGGSLVCQREVVSRMYSLVLRSVLRV